MYRLDREDFLKSPYIGLWALLGFQAGFINAFGFLASGRFVSHVTGFGTQIGLSVASHNYWFALEFAGFPLFFIFGAFLSGFFSSARMERGLKPRYDLVTFLMPASLFILVTLGFQGVFGPFGEQLIQARDFVLLFSLSMVCGMQNGCFATMTRGQIRTTHLTGISTDMGTDLARTLFGNLKGAERELTFRTNVTRLATFCSFAGGSILSVLASQKFEYLALAIPFFTSAFIFSRVKRISRELDLVLIRKNRASAKAS